MSSKRYKIEAVKQVTERGFSVYDVAARLGTTTHSLYAWIRQYGSPPSQHATITDQQAEIKRLKAELRRVTEEQRSPPLLSDSIPNFFRILRPSVCTSDSASTQARKASR